MTKNRKRTNGQVLAAVVHTENLKRNEMLKKELWTNDNHLNNALSELQKAKEFIGNPSKILGNPSTKHGEIAEHLQVRVSNAYKLFEGLAPEYTFDGVNRTAAEDYLKDGRKVQSKFLNGPRATLLGNGKVPGILQHSEKYDNFVDEGGLYEIAKNQFEEMVSRKELREISPSVLTKKDLRLLRDIDTFESKTGMKIGEQVKPAIVTYNDVQQGAAPEFLNNTENDFIEKNRELCEQLREQYKPSLKEGIRAAGVGALLEGGSAGLLTIYDKTKDGKKIREFSSKDWKEIGSTTVDNSFKGGIRGTVVYAVSNYTVIPECAASGLVTATYGIVEEAAQYKKGNIPKEVFIMNSEEHCFDTAVGVISSAAGQALIPIPVVGALIGNTVGNVINNRTKKSVKRKTKKEIKRYQEELDKKDTLLEEKHQMFLRALTAESREFDTAMEMVLNPDPEIALKGANILAHCADLLDKEIIKTV